MIALSHKSTHYATIALKVLVLGLTCWYLTYTITHLTDLSWQQFLQQWSGLSIESIGLVFLLALINWALEIKKWQLLARTIHPLNFLKAAKQTLVSFTLSITTPNRLGEYPAKALFFPKKNLKHVLWLNLTGNLAQMGVTLLFGLAGLWFWWSKFPLDGLAVGGIILASVIAMGLLLFYLQKLRRKNVHFFDKISPKIPATLGLATLKYVSFATAFLWLLTDLSTAEVSVEIIALLGCYYLFISLLPSWLVLDVIVKGGTAVWLFAWAGIDPLAVMCAVLIMWLFNYLLPALVGAGIFSKQSIGRYE